MKQKYIPLPGYREYFTLIILCAEFVLFALLSNKFLTEQNVTQIIQNASEIAIISIGMTIVIILGGIDISVGSVLGVCAIVAARLSAMGVNPILVVVLTICSGIVAGAANGLLVSLLKVPELIATLATMNFWRAIIFLMLGGSWLTGFPTVFNNIASGITFSIPNILFFILILYFVFWFVLTYRPFGRHLYAIGTNMEAARLNGIKVKKMKFASYMLLGALVGLSAIFYIDRMGTVEMTIGSDLAMQCIAAVVIGGTSITGGRGSVVGTLAGVLFVAVMSNGIVLLGVPSLLDHAIVGSLIIISIIIDVLLRKRIKKRRVETKTRLTIS
ncbi:ABC transporter permease [Sporolactobacillus kofuensis]|uniref:Autoinducer 2 import system permease protein LsrC n=1 Tax=Sporolactobacillus kofuensis TaxID=269672 RepID=A0ABW1WBJ8_9BACL|nr:ABC transporter permease [Sporolactobacillus kofuensis]MCO7174824.1 ABC transporter permease [Sporolactobacillus kofuensis]